MRKILFVFLSLFVLNSIFCQAQKFNYTIDSVIYELSIEKQSEKKIVYCFNVTGSLKKEIEVTEDTCFTSDKLTKEQLQIQLISYYQKITKAEVNDPLKAEMIKISEELFTKYEDEDKYEEIEYGKKLYYGLSEKEVELLLKKQDTLISLQQAIKRYRVKSEFNTKFEKNCFSKSLEYAKIKSIHKTYLDEFFEKNKEPDQKFVDTSEVYELLRFERKLIKRDIKSLYAKRKPIVSFIGNANVVASYKLAEQTQINAGFGIEVMVPAKSDFIGILTVAQSNDTIVSSEINDFGQSILVPGVRRFSLLTSYRNYSMFPRSGSRLFKKLGIAFNANVTPYRWSLKKADGTPDSLTTRVVPVAADLIIPFTWVSIYEDDKDVAISTDFGLSFRYIGGNVTTEQLTTFIHRSSRFYAGVVFGLNIKYNGLRAQFHGPIFWGDQVDGLTRGQVYASIGFVSSILSNEKGILKKK